MKSLMTILTLSILLVACGDNESGGSSSSSSLSNTSDYGLKFVSTGASSANTYNGGETMTIQCVDNNKKGLTNAKRMQKLQQLRDITYKKTTIKINGKKYDSQSIGLLLDRALNEMQHLSQTYGNGYGNNTGINNINGGGAYFYGSIGFGNNGYNNYNNNNGYNNYNNNNGYNNYNNNNGNYNNTQYKNGYEPCYSQYLTPQIQVFRSN